MKNFSEISGLPGLNFDTSYAGLPDRFYANIHARTFSGPQLVKLNEALARELGLDFENADKTVLARALAGNDHRSDEEGSLLAMAYSGHQFGHFNPGLGDGRAGLIGEVIDVNGQRRDLHLKGSGPTPFSRNGDGLAALGPVMREYIVAEAMHALGVPTTRSLSIVLTGDKVWREEILPGAVLARVAASHLRVGTFQHFAARQDREGLEILTRYAIDRHYGGIANHENPPLELLKAVSRRQADLVAQWMGLGFIHGVMNTDNMTISGETIDYGPCAFMDHYDHGKVFSSIDQQGRYAYGNQPQIAQWNLARLAETLVPLIDTDEDKAVEIATAVVREFAELYTTAWRRTFSPKLGLEDVEASDEIIRRYLTLMHKQGADFTTAFRLLTESAGNDLARGDLTFLFRADPDFEPWFEDWKNALGGDVASVVKAMRKANPVYIPRNHLVEEAIRAGEDREDFGPMEKLLEKVLDPYRYSDTEPDTNSETGQKKPDRYMLPPEPGEEVLKTFCGT